MHLLTRSPIPHVLPPCDRFPIQRESCHLPWGLGLVVGNCSQWRECGPMCGRLVWSCYTASASGPMKLPLDSKNQAVRGPSHVESLLLLPLALGHAPPEARFLSEEASTGFQLSAISVTGSCSVCKNNGCVSRPQSHLHCVLFKFLTHRAHKH